MMEAGLWVGVIIFLGVLVCFFTMLAADWFAREDVD